MNVDISHDNATFARRSNGPDYRTFLFLTFLSPTRRQNVNTRNGEQMK